MKWYIITLLLLLIITPAVFADTIYGTVIQTDFYPVTSLNITILAPNLTTVVNNANMTYLAVGRYVYNFTPEVVGEYLVTMRAYNATSLIGTGTTLLESQTPNIPAGDNNMAIVTIIAIIAVLASLLYLTFKLDAQYMAIKLLLLLVSMGLIVLLAYSAVESKICYPIYAGSAVTLSCLSDNSTSALILFYTVCIVYSVFFLYVGFKLVADILNYFRKLRVN